MSPKKKKLLTKVAEEAVKKLEEIKELSNSLIQGIVS